MSLNIHQRHLLKSKDIKQLILQITAQFGEEVASSIVSNKSKVEWIKIENNEELYAIDNVLALWLSENRFIPLLSYP